MKYNCGAAIAIGLGTFCTSAFAAGMPQVLLTQTNQPPACATPGRLMAFLEKRNPALRSRFEKIAMYYMKHGEALNVRWDYAFFQMQLETASLKYTGDVNWRQNNFAGLGATGGGVKGERFKSVSDGVRAHLEHLLIYAGVNVADPVAERTRKVQAWKVLDSWQRSIRGPMTYGHIGKKWAPSDRDYANDIKSFADAFYASSCNRPDPRPELLAEARGQQSRIATAKTFGGSSAGRSSLGAANLPTRPHTTPVATPTQSARLPAGVKVLNGSPDADARGSSNGQSRQVAAAAGNFAAKFANPGLRPQTQAPPAAPRDDAAAVAGGGKAPAQKRAPQKQAKINKCRVWTASYGGQKAIIIKSSDTSHVNYTVLDVHAGRERQETAAYIAAYARGGKKVGEFKSQSLALDRAFKLCPDS